MLFCPRLRWSGPVDLRRRARTGTSVTAVVPEFDDFLPPAKARQRFRAIPLADVVVVEGGEHRLFGRTQTVLDEVVARVHSGRRTVPPRGHSR